MLHPKLRTTPIALSLLLALGFSSTVSATVAKVPSKMSVQQAETANNSAEVSRQIRVVQNGSPVYFTGQHKRNRFTHPTQSSGFWANKGEILSIEYQHQGEDIDALPELWIVPIKKGKEENFKLQVVKLQEGINEIEVANTGPLYFAATNQPGSSEITVNLLKGGKPMPRFILGENTAEEWQQQLVKFSDAPFAELVGKRMILTMPIKNMRKQATDPEGVLLLWDRIVDLAEEQFGLSAERAFPHRATPFQYQFVSKPDNTDGLMSAMNYWLGTNGSSIPEVITTELLQKAWGPWHELGHHYQMPAWTFDGDTETTVNLTSLYIQRALGETSRLEAESRWDSVDALMKTSGHNYESVDSFIRLAMFWQLDLAFGQDFYSRLGDRYRTLTKAEQPKNNDEKKQRFILETSRVAGVNLESFFQHWGLKPTQETSAQLHAMSLPQLTKPIWLNTDSNIAHSYLLTEQNITGDVRLPDTVNAGDVFSVSVEVTNRNTSALSYQWDIPAGVEVIADKGNEITLRAPHNVLQNAMLSIPVTVTDAHNMAMRLASSTRLKTEGKNISVLEAYNALIKQRYQIEGELNVWNDASPKGIPETFYQSDSLYFYNRDYFRLKTESYWYFPTDKTSNRYWEYLDSYDDSQYLSGEVIETITPVKPVEKPKQCSAPSWEQKNYDGFTTISKDGRVYTSKWWVSAGSIPGDNAVTDTSGNGTDWGKVWEDKGLCDTAVKEELQTTIEPKPVAPQQCSAPSWEQKVYEVPTTISKDGRVYSNKWWVSAENKPGDSAVTDTSGNGTDWGKVWEDKGGC
ncbi:M60 family metallopeptidase [Yersinia mollaretii]|uniref:N-acetylglucosamine-binding protein A n=1 Tax=Yersinia mollaretii TaxID=33060 RepID=A0AA36LLI7_YERMO|nr:M60 family metallopeptidase [Yersinia mollaretii]CNH43105.1 N-acetylglucosamine-binding protein A [Yersinia mollaretii]